MMNVTIKLLLWSPNFQICCFFLTPRIPGAQDLVGWLVNELLGGWVINSPRAGLWLLVALGGQMLQQTTGRISTEFGGQVGQKGKTLAGTYHAL